MRAFDNIGLSTRYHCYTQLLWLKLKFAFIYLDSAPYLTTTKKSNY